MQDQVADCGLSDAVLELLASPLLGPCRVQHLSLRDQDNITGRGIAALAGGRFPGGFSCALSDRLLRCPLRCTCACCSMSTMIMVCFCPQGIAKLRKLLRIPAVNNATHRHIVIYGLQSWRG